MVDAITLSELHEWAEEEELHDVLDARLHDVVGELRLNSRDYDALCAVIVGLELGTVRELLSDEVAFHIARVGGKRCCTRVIEAIEPWLNDRWDAREEREAVSGASVAAAQAEEAPSFGPEPPEDPAHLAAWAEASGVAHRLGQHVQLVSRYTQMSTALILLSRAGFSIADLLRGGRKLPHGVSARDVADLARHARTYLRDGAENARIALERKRALDARAVEPPSPRVRAFADRLRDVRRDAAVPHALRRPADYLVMGVSFDHTRGVLLYAERASKNAHQQTLFELSVDPPALDRALELIRIQQRPDQISALDAFLDVLRDPEAPAHAPVVARLSRPPWERVVARVDEHLARVARVETGPKPRLAFRIRLEANLLRIEPLVQQARADGAYSKGAAIATSDAVSGLARGNIAGTPGDEALLAQIAGTMDTFGPDRQFRVAALLGRLRHHPHVVVGGRTHVPAKIRDARIALALEPDEDGDAGEARFSFVVGATRLRASEVRAMLGEGNTTFRVDDATGEVDVVRADDATRALVAALSEIDVPLPVEAQRTIVGRLSAVAPDLDLELPDALCGRLVEGSSAPVVRLAPPDDSGALELAFVVRPLPSTAFEPGEGPARVLGAIEGEAVTAVRDREVERREAEALAAALGLGADDALGSHRYRVADPDRALDVVDALDARAGEIAVEWPEERPRVEGKASLDKLRVRVRSARDWFGLDGDVEIGESTVALAALLAAIRRGARYVQLGKRRFARIADDLRERLASVADVVRDGKAGAEFTIGALPAIDALVDGVPGADLAKSFVELRQRMRRASVEEPTVPKDLRAELRPYQAEGVRWLLRLRAWAGGACLADDMGLGKTLQALAILLAGAAEGPSLVVAPTSVVANWAAEAARFAPSLRVRVLRGPERERALATAKAGDLLVTSYDLMIRDVDSLATIRFANVVFDEAQALKNAATQRAKAARELGASFRLALSGTPIENHLGELWSLYRVVVPGLLGSAEQFRERFAIPIERAQDRTRQAALSRVVRPFLLRRTKAQVAPELPPRTEIVREIELSTAERQLYDAARLAALGALSGPNDGTDRRFAILAAMTRLRRLACHPRLVDESSTVPSSKLAAFLELARELKEAGQKALVFSQFTTHLAIVRDALAREGITFVELDGSTPAEQREKRVAAFQAGRADVFLISLKAGGTGLNLTAAEAVIHLDPWWNPAAEDQATDRAHRIGQTKPVTVVRLVARGTIEQAVIALHGEKRALAQGLLEGAEVAGALSSEELMALVRAGEGAVEVAGGADGDGGASADGVAELSPKRRATRRRAGREREPA